MKVAAITGVAGFVGSNLAHQMIQEGWFIRGLDNMSQGYLDNLDRLIQSRQFEFMQGDVRDKATVHSLLSGSDIVAHLAAFKIPRYGNALAMLHTGRSMVQHWIRGKKLETSNYSITQNLMRGLPLVRGGYGPPLGLIIARKK